ncbi:uncharacterized protein LOC144554551 isoform X2 [Carex rostrata]
MQEEAKNEGTKSKGVFSNNYLNLGGGGACDSPPYPSAGYPSQYGSSYSQQGLSYAQHGSSYPHHGYAPPPTTYPSNGYPQSCYPSPPPAPVETCNPYKYGHAPYGSGKHQQQHGYAAPNGPGKHQQQHGYAAPNGPGKHQQQHGDYYHRHEEFNMYEGYAKNNHGYGRRRRYGMSREVPSDAKV